MIQSFLQIIYAMDGEPADLKETPLEFEGGATMPMASCRKQMLVRDTVTLPVQ